MNPDQDKPEHHLQKRKFYVQMFINTLLLFRPYYQQIPLQIFFTLFICMTVFKYYRQGNTISIIGIIFSFIVIITAQIIKNQNLMHFGCFITVVNMMFGTPNIYKLPKCDMNIGLRQSVRKINQNNELYWTEWYPVISNCKQNESQQQDIYKIKWAHTVQMDKMAQYMKFNKPLIKLIFKFAISSMLKYQLTFSKNKQIKTSKLMFFSHGRSGTPFMYSSILINIAKQYKIYAPQHNQVAKTPYTKVEQVKNYREKQVKQRAEQIIEIIKNVHLTDDSQIFLMGHSYGCSTILQAYLSLNLAMRKKVKAIILLDPWLFPLENQYLQENITCPILMLANEYFIQIQDIFYRNKQFVETNKERILYICWKKAHHLHQTDVPFIVGSSLGVIKNIEDSLKLFNKNTSVINEFLRIVQNSKINEKQSFYYQLRKKYNQILIKNQLDILPQNYMPQKWNTKFTF